MAYSALKPGAATDSIQLWAAACALVSLTLALACFLIYKIIMASNFLLLGALQYSLGGLAMIGIAMSVIGVMFFNRQEDGSSHHASAAAATAAKQADKTLSYEYSATSSSSSSYHREGTSKSD